MKIKEFKVYGFWGKYDVRWEMKSNVNVLVGINGLGKSSLLKLLAYCLNPEDDSKVAWEEVAKLAEEVEIIFENGGIIRADLEEFKRNTGNFNVREFIKITEKDISAVLSASMPLLIKTFDHTQSLDEVLGLKNSEGFFSGLIGHFFDYRNEKIAAFLDKGKGNFEEEMRDIDDLYTIIDKYFADSDKKISKGFRNKEFIFEPTNVKVDDLSSGEKQLLVLFLATFLQKEQETFLLLDEPETSLHTLWQENLFTDLLLINPNCQLIVVTHAPSTFGYGWVSNRVKINEIIFPIGTLLQKNASQMENNDHQNFPESVKSILEFIDNQHPITYQTTYEINIRLKDIDTISLEYATEIIKKMDAKRIKVDVITITTLINRVFAPIEQVKGLLKIVQPTIQPNDYAFNSLLKKAVSVENGIQFIAEFIADYSNIKPDIFTFSTLLGKATNVEEVELVEKQRKYYEVKANEFYNSKLHFKLAK